MKEKTKKILIIIILIVMSFIICFQCGTNPITQKKISTDSSVFIYIAKSMQDGLLPYKDIFDHKGPLQYLINYIGIMIGNNTYIGIWIIEIISMIVSLLFMYKIAKLFIKNQFIALLPVILSVIPISQYLQGGNLTEEYALPFILISLYYMTKYIVQTNNLKKMESFIIGICMSFVLLLRPNMVILWIVYCIIIFIDMIKNKKYIDAKNTVIYFLLGTLSVLCICGIILHIKGILMDCINDYIIFNFRYIEKGKISLIEALTQFTKISGLIIVTSIICIISIVNKIIKKERGLILPISCLLYSIFTFAIIVIPKRYFAHYAIILIPTFLIPLSIAIQYIQNTKHKKIGIISIILISILANGINILTTASIYKNIFIKEPQNKETVELIQEHSQPEDKIMVIGNECLIYLNSDRKCASKYIYQPSIIGIDNKIREEVKNDINSDKSKIIVCTKEIIQDSSNIDIKEIIDNLVKENKYEELKENEKYLILERK